MIVGTEFGRSATPFVFRGREIAFFVKESVIQFIPLYYIRMCSRCQVAIRHHWLTALLRQVFALYSWRMLSITRRSFCVRGYRSGIAG